ncbi:hypothetical protein ACPCG0_03190 [Propionibacteriaceae bacterium Y1923]
MARQIITADAIHQAAAGGSTEIQLEADAIVTDAARELAESKSVRLVRPGGDADTGRGSGAAPASSEGPGDRQQVRQAVIAALGGEVPAGLDAAISRAIGN